MGYITDVEGLATTILQLAKDVKYAKATSSASDSRRSLLDHIHQLQAEVAEPVDVLEQCQVNYQQLSSLQWLVRFHILSHIPQTGTLPFETVASAANVPLQKLQSITRMTMTSGILSEPAPGHLAHSRLSRPLASNDALKNWLSFLALYSCPTALCQAEATAKWGDTLAKNETAYNVFAGTASPFFEHVSQSREMSEAFAGYMRGLSVRQDDALAHVVAGYDWAGLGAAHVVDVGGSGGHVSVHLAERFPQLRFTITDLPETVDVARREFAKRELDPSIASRIDFYAADFFTTTTTTTTEGDIYLLRKILHDWPFDAAHTILQGLVDAIQPGASILVMDTILPRAGTTSARHEALLRVRDLTMMQSFNSRERELDDWLGLFGSTRPRLELRRTTLPAGSAMAVMELVRESESSI